MASHAMKLNEGKKISSSNQGNEVSQSDLDLHWWCRKHKDNIVDDLDYEIVAKTLESIVNMGLPSLYPGGDEQMNLSSFFNYANLEFVDADRSKEVGKRQSPACGSPSRSKFSVHGLENFDLASKAVDKPCSEIPNSTTTFRPYP
uniref:Uncharacterized protein n=1 Tax=Fagus sylvatica TaxID=28930 RepID=A0A2N9I3X2_FAGSY